MVTGVDVVTALVLTVNVALLAPAATVTLAGTVAVDVLLLVRVTAAPPAGAGPLSVTVPVEDCAPPVTVVGFSVSVESVGDACGATAGEAVLVTSALSVHDVARVVVVAAVVVTVNVALLAPAATVMLESTLADTLSLESNTCAPPASAGPLSVTVPVEDCTPPVTLVGFSVSVESVGRACGTTVSEAVWVTPA